MSTTKRQTTVLIGGSNGTKTLCSILGDKSNPINKGHVLRVVSRSPNRFQELKAPMKWTCHEQKSMSNLAPFAFLPKSWSTHVGQPDSVFGYDELGAALSGINAPDDGGAADIILLCCPVHAHLQILREVAKTLYKLNEEGMLMGSKSLLIGTLYAAGGFDWMCKIAFCVEKPGQFMSWSRPLALFGLRSFPYLCKSLKPGSVTLYGRFPQLTVAVCPARPLIRHRVNELLGRVLQCDQTNIHLDFLGLSSDLDNADPHCALGFLTCTLNSTNQLLHPTIIYDLFKEGSIPWPTDSKTTLPRFYADGATPEVGKLITDIGAVEYYPILHTLDTLLAPHGMNPISYSHGGEPVGRFFLNQMGNSPQDLAQRSGITDYVTYHEHPTSKSLPSTQRPNFNMRPLFEFMLYFGLSRNARLGSVLSPAYRDPHDPNCIKPNVKTRFFIDDIPHGLCIILGIAELLGLSLTKHTPVTLKLVRKLQSWMGKQYVLPHDNINLRIVADARDLKESSAPQAFGIYTISQFRDFLNMDPFGVDQQLIMENTVRCSPMFGANLTEHQFIRSKL